MGFGGSVAAMITSLRSNKRERVSRFDKDKRKQLLNEPKGNHDGLIDHTKMGPYEFHLFKRKLERQAKRDTRIRLVALAIITILVVTIVGILIY